MSSFDLNRSRVQARAVQAAEPAKLLRTALADLMGDPTQWREDILHSNLVSSCDLRSLASDVSPEHLTGRLSKVGAGSVDLRSLCPTLEDQPLVGALLRRGAPEELAAARTALEVAQAIRRSGGKAALVAGHVEKDAARHLRAALDTTARCLAVDERHVVAAASQRALARLGYSVQRYQGQRSTGLWAIRGDTVVAAIVQDGGTLETDLAGCPGNSCVPAIAELTESLRQEGVELEVLDRTPHGDDRGGELLRRAAKAGGGPEGLVRQFEVGLAQTTDREEGVRASVPVREGGSR